MVLFAEVHIYNIGLSRFHLQHHCDSCRQVYSDSTSAALQQVHDQAGDEDAYECHLDSRRLHQLYTYILE